MKASREAFSIKRTFDAPRDLVFRLWTEDEHLQHWFGPKGTKIFHSRNDFRPGGTYHYGMRLPDGGEMWGRWVYREIVPPERLIFVSSFSDPEGGLQRAPFDEPWPMEMLATITFQDRGGRTEVTVQWIPIGATDVEWETFNAGRASMKGGWSGTFEQLESYIAKRSPGRSERS